MRVRGEGNAMEREKAETGNFRGLLLMGMVISYCFGSFSKSEFRGLDDDFSGFIQHQPSLDSHFLTFRSLDTTPNLSAALK